MSVFSDKTYENLMASALGRVDDSLDKREGSMIFNGNAPCLAELAQMYIALDFILDATFIQSAPREYLIRRAADRSIAPKEATRAVYRGRFNAPVSVGMRFNCEDLNFIVTEPDADNDSSDGYAYLLECETAGAVGNSFTGGNLVRIVEASSGATDATVCVLEAVVIYGMDDEDTEVFRARVLEAMRSIAFGGNVADYKQKALTINGVRAVKVKPVWNNDITPASLVPSSAVQEWYAANIDSITTAGAAAGAWLTAVYTAALAEKLTVGGTVGLIVLANGDTPEGCVPSSTLIDTVKEEFDPVAGEGLGLAPIGHVVNVSAVSTQEIDVAISVTAAGGNAADLTGLIRAELDRYFYELCGTWADQNRIIVRESQLVYRLFAALGAAISDVTCTLTGADASGNITLGEDKIPKLGSLTVT